MDDQSKALWRIEFRTDTTSAEQPVIVLGYMLEANWKAGARAIGLSFRCHLAPLEQDRVNFETWHELKDLECFMLKLFDDAVAVDGNAPLRSSAIASQYPVYSALNFVREDVQIDTENFDKSSIPAFAGKLYELMELLGPTISAPVHQFKPKTKKPAIPDYVPDSRMMIA